MQPGGRSYAVLIESDWNLKDLTDNLCLPSH